MKKVLLAMLLISAVLVSCGGDNGDPAVTGTTTDTASVTDSGTDAVTESETAADETETDSFVCELDNGVTVILGGDLPDLGDPVNYAEAASCVHPGMDKVYTYDGFTVTTSPDADGNDFVSEVSLISDKVSLNGGIKLGAAKDTVISVLGDDYTEQFGVMTYHRNDVTLSVVLDDNSNVLSFTAAVVQ